MHTRELRVTAIRVYDRYVSECHPFTWINSGNMFIVTQLQIGTAHIHVKDSYLLTIQLIGILYYDPISQNIMDTYHLASGFKNKLKIISETNIVAVLYFNFFVLLLREVRFHSKRPAHR